MGRVSKHKKIKSCDPFYKGPVRHQVRKGDLAPPNDDDQAPPKALLHLFKYRDKKKATRSAAEQPASARLKFKSKKGKKNTPPQGVTGAPTRGATAGTQDGAGGLGKGSAQHQDHQGDPPPTQGRAAMFVRRPGESTKMYLERIDIESKSRIAGCFRKENKKSDRRKRYSQERRKKLKGQKLKKAERLVKDFDDFQDHVKFGEVVQAPPTLSARPRGSEKKSNNRAASSAAKLEFLKTCPWLLDPSKPAVVGLKHQKDVEEERETAIMAYRQAKKLRLANTKDRT